MNEHELTDEERTLLGALTKEECWARMLQYRRQLRRIAEDDCADVDPWELAKVTLRSVAEGDGKAP